MQLISDKVVITRKPHKCCICERVFEEDSSMQRQAYVYDGINTSYTCLTCNQLIKDNYIQPDDNEGIGNWYTSESLFWSMESDNFKGTPEEYLEYKNKLCNK